MRDHIPSSKPFVPDLKCSAVGGGDPYIADIIQKARDEARRLGISLEDPTPRVVRDEAAHFRPPGLPVDNG